MSKVKSLKDTQRELMMRVKTEGVKAAYEASLSICNDSAAPSPARATASATLFRVAGYFDKREPDASEKEPHEMTSEELTAAINELRLHALSMRGEDEPVDIFG